MTIDEKIKDEKKKKNCDQIQMIQQPEFTYSPIGKALTKTIEYQEKNKLRLEKL